MVEKKRPVTDELRRTVIEDLPEIADIKDPKLREGVVEAWAMALAGSSFGRIKDIPGDANPGVMALYRGMQDVHLRGVARLALGIADHFKDFFPEIDVDRDIVVGIWPRRVVDRQRRFACAFRERDLAQRHAQVRRALGRCINLA